MQQTTRRNFFKFAFGALCGGGLLSRLRGRKRRLFKRVCIKQKPCVKLYALAEDMEQEFLKRYHVHFVEVKDFDFLSINEVRRINNV